jgi:transcriptional regulator with XRE-family HTH domain
MVIGDRLKELRESKELSQGDIEKRTGLLRSYISRVETGIPFQRFRRSKRWHVPWKCRCTSSFMKAKQQRQFAS